MAIWVTLVPKNKMLHSLRAHAGCTLAWFLPMVGFGQCFADINGNQQIDNDDLLILLAQYGNACFESSWEDPVISEIHYNPSTQQGADSEYEFVELMNPHPFALNVGGWALADGIDAVIPDGTMIPAGGFLVTANDTAMYRAMLGPFESLVPWSGTSSLHNSGETIRLIRPDGTEADVVTYSDTNGWSTGPDGGGGSLEWKGSGWDNALPEAWIESNAFGGSPGADNSSWAD